MKDTELLLKSSTSESNRALTCAQNKSRNVFLALRTHSSLVFLYDVESHWKSSGFLHFLCDFLGVLSFSAVHSTATFAQNTFCITIQLLYCSILSCAQNKSRTLLILSCYAYSLCMSFNVESRRYSRRLSSFLFFRRTFWKKFRTSKTFPTL